MMKASGSPQVRVLFVCMGNICRSPTAHAVMRKLLLSRNLEQVMAIDSAGTINYHEGRTSDQRSREVGEKRGYVFDHLARAVTVEDFGSFDYIVAMDNENLGDLQRMAPLGAKAKLSLLMSHCDSPSCREVPDPYYGGPLGFEKVLDLVETGCEALLGRIVRDRGL